MIVFRFVQKAPTLRFVSHSDLSRSVASGIPTHVLPDWLRGATEQFLAFFFLVAIAERHLTVVRLRVGMCFHIQRRLEPTGRLTSQQQWSLYSAGCPL